MADEASGESKPQPKQEGKIINLIIKDQLDGEVHFKIKSHTKFEKVGLYLACWCTPCDKSAQSLAGQTQLQGRAGTTAGQAQL